MTSDIPNMPATPDIKAIEDVNKKLQQKAVAELKHQQKQEREAFERGELSEYYPHMTLGDLEANQANAWKLFYGEAKTEDFPIYGMEQENISEPTPEATHLPVLIPEADPTTTTPHDYTNDPRLAGYKAMQTDRFNQAKINTALTLNQKIPPRLTKEFINAPLDHLYDPDTQTLALTQDGRWYELVTTDPDGTKTHTFYINTTQTHTYPKCIMRDTFMNYPSRDVLGQPVPSIDADYYDENVARLRSRKDSLTTLDIHTAYTKVTAKPIGLFHTYFYLAHHQEAQEWDAHPRNTGMFERGMMFDKDNNLVRPVIYHRELPRDMFPDDKTYENYNAKFANNIAEADGSPDRKRLHTVMLHPAMGTNIPHAMIFHAEHVRNILNETQHGLTHSEHIADQIKADKDYIATEQARLDPQLRLIAYMDELFYQDAETSAVHWRHREYNPYFPFATYSRIATHNAKKAGMIAGTETHTKTRTVSFSFEGRSYTMTHGKIAYILQHRRIPDKAVKHMDGNPRNCRAENLTSAQIRSLVYTDQTYRAMNMPRPENAKARTIQAAKQKFYRARKSLSGGNTNETPRILAPEELYELQKNIWREYGLDPDEIT